MTDQNSQFFAILTAVGEAKQANADALGVPWTFAQMGVGDANGTEPIPSRTQTKLINERRRAPLNQVKVDPKNASIIIAEQIIPESIGGWWIREIGLYDAAGDLVAIANCAPTFKPLLTQGSGRTQVIRINLIVSNTSNIELKIDPSVVLATREYVDAWFLNVLPETRPEGRYTRVNINKRGIVVGGDNPSTFQDMGLIGGTLFDSINMAEAKAIYIQPVGSPSWASGLIAGSNGGEKGGLGFTGSYNAITSMFMGLGSTPWASGNGIRVTSSGVDITGPITGVGSGLTGLKFSALTGTPNTLAGYGVSFASQVEAETGADTNKPMNALRVFQAIAAKVIQATESAMGLARIAPQNVVNAGDDDITIVTPKKQRWGFRILIGRVGYIVFPTWLKGWIVQWNVGVSLTGSAINTTYFPIPFPTDVGAVVVGAYNNNASGDYSVRLSDGIGGASGAVYADRFTTYNTGVTGSAGLSFIAVGT
ncbi:phage tail protein [Pseudomonas veronii]|uniref:phage tail protein n=1 Tax=Pseudomonas veronii TaxID=76761 RepID=UPI0009A4801E|nr:phage tail protein [Pseudomonas veronii]AQY65045.1 phage tail protein [Pseudomonas veronii]